LRRGNSKDGRPDAKQIVVAVVKKGDKSLVGNKGYRRYLKSGNKGFSIDEEQITEDERFDGKWVLRTNTDLGAWEVAIQYKQLWTGEASFETRNRLTEGRLAATIVFSATSAYLRWDQPQFSGQLVSIVSQFIEMTAVSCGNIDGNVIADYF
jgi:hypothetical protein